MSLMVTNTMDIVAGVSDSNKTVTKNTSNESFDQILNQQTDHQMENKEVNKPTREIKTTNTRKVSKTEDKRPESKIASTVDLDKLEKDIVEKVTEILGISEEELNQILAELNMTAFDLLLPDKLTNFLTSLFNVEDSFQLLSMPDATALVKELKAELNTLTDTLDLSADDIKDLVSKIDTEKVHNQPLDSENPLAKDDGQASTSEENMIKVENQGPQIDITDERTVKDNASQVGDETKSDMNKTFDETVDITVNQTVQKVEIIDQNGVKEVITYNINTEEVIDQIVSSVKVNLTDDTNTMFIQLRPEHLGKLAFSLTSEQGVVTANFMAENPAVKELIESNLAQLRVSLQQQGITVDKLEVVVSDNNLFNQQNDQNQFSNSQDNKRKRAAKMMTTAGILDEAVSEEVAEVRESITAQIGETSSVDYSV